MVSKKDIKLAS